MEVQQGPDDFIDLWSREHYKSTIITFGKTIQDILASHGDDPLPVWEGREATVGIFSNSRPNAKDFLRMVKFEFEGNARLKEWFPDVLWADPRRQAPKWSEDEGIVVRRRSNPREATVEAWGLVDGQPIGKHFVVLVYDDVVTPDSVGTSDMMAKTTNMFELSSALGSDGGRTRIIGTRYHSNDTYGAIIKKDTATPRYRYLTVDGTFEGVPTLRSREWIDEKRKKLGPYNFAAQMLQNPTADKTQGFRREWMRHYSSTPLDAGGGTNKYMLVDAANEKRKENDYTSMWVLGLGADSNFYVLEMLRDRLNLTERADAVFRLHRRWRPRQVRYEQYGMMADVQHIKDRQNRENYRFEIISVAGQTPKNDRIKRLVPAFEQGKFYFPQTFHYVDYEKKPLDLVHTFIEEEFAAFPVALHDDMLDSLARIMEPANDRPELALIWPTIIEEESKQRYRGKREEEGSAWAA